MDQQQLLVIGARNELRAVLRAAQKRRPWHYALNGVSDHELTLASLIGMTTVQAQSLLLVCGLSKKCCRTIAPKPDVVAKSDVVAKPDALKAFAIEQNLNEEYFYFDRHKVKYETAASRYSKTRNRRCTAYSTKMPSVALRLSGVTTNDLTLASLLGMTPEQSDQLVVLVCGLFTKSGSQDTTISQMVTNKTKFVIYRISFSTRCKTLVKAAFL